MGAPRLTDRRELLRGKISWLNSKPLLKTARSTPRADDTQSDDAHSS